MALKVNHCTNPVAVLRIVWYRELSAVIFWKAIAINWREASSGQQPWLINGE